jgi:hypothetical protein
MSFNIDLSDLDRLQSQLNQLLQALQSLEGEIARVGVDPNDPGSAIRKMELAVDSKAAPYSENPFVSQVIGDVKGKLRQRILEIAKEAKNKTEPDSRAQAN